MINVAAQVLIAGSGVMGLAIARTFADAGMATAILSRNPQAVADPPPGVAVTGTLPAEPPELIIESIPEQMPLKLTFNQTVEDAYGGKTILASNTSSLPLQKMADHLRHPSAFCGIHYFQPADLTPLVELARIDETDDHAMRLAQRLLERSGKKVVVLRRPVQGLLINRLQHAILNEAYHMIDAGLCTAADVDLAAKELLGPRMSVTGLIEQKDLSGLDTHARAQIELVPSLDQTGVAAQVIRQKLEGNQLGIKTGTGFYRWKDVDLDTYRQQTGALLRTVIDRLDQGRPKPPPLADPSIKDGR